MISGAIIVRNAVRTAMCTLLMFSAACERRAEVGSTSDKSASAGTADASRRTSAAAEMSHQQMWANISSVSPVSDVTWFDDLLKCDENTLRTASYSVIADGAPGGVMNSITVRIGTSTVSLGSDRLKSLDDAVVRYREGRGDKNGAAVLRRLELLIAGVMDAAAVSDAQTLVRMSGAWRLQMLKRLQEVESDSNEQSAINDKMDAIKAALKSDRLPKAMP